MTEFKLNILDCTLRDGGYYNNWDFEPHIVLEYLEAVAEAEVEFVELGLRQFNNEKYLGAHAYTTREYLERLDLPVGPTYGAMIDAKTVLSRKESQEECIDQLFFEAKDESVSLVRVVAHFGEVSDCHRMLARLKEKGYIVGLNIMQASLRNVEELTNLSSMIARWGCIDVVYFADSLGCMDKSDMERVYNSIRHNWSKDIGFHAHNNMGQAISNVNTAIELGCNWIDSTVTGMGRGAGNAETEYLLLEPKIRDPRRKLEKLFSLAITHFEVMKKSSGWGVSIPYYISALKHIHPTYVQELCADSSVITALLPNLLNDLGETTSPHVYNKMVLESVKSKMAIQDKHIDGAQVPEFLQAREIVLVAQTESSVRYADAISDYAKKKNAILISINFPSMASELAYDYIAVLHNEKFRVDEYKYQNSRCPFIGPKQLFSGLDIEIAYDYGFSIKDYTFKNCGTYACIPFPLTLAYAISFCIDAGADTIKLAGFCGFNQSNPRQKEMETFLSILSSHKVKLLSLTPTSFSIGERSIYAI